MSESQEAKVKYHRLVGIAVAIAGVVLWPEELTLRHLAAILLFASLLMAMFLVEIAPWGYRWIWFSVVIPLSFLASAAMAWSAGAEPSNVAATAGILGATFSALAFFVAKRR